MSVVGASLRRPSHGLYYGSVCSHDRSLVAAMGTFDDGHLQRLRDAEATEISRCVRRSPIDCSGTV